MKAESPLMLPVMLNMLKKRLDGANAGLLEKYGLSKLHLLYLLVLYENGEGMTLKELSDFLDFDKANTSRAISQLTAKEYVRKSPQGALDLKYKVELTQAGRDVAAVIWRHNHAVNSGLVRLFTPEELATLLRIAGKLRGFLAGNPPDQA
ncbi:MAG TPA: MarR family transcriptional regulator [Candidatus Limnocylindria bacterium]|nr:MarR family transcriptional regulator [Candidatus Limnocylindria bacterium]